MISINWRRGLFRLWIAASIVWLVGGGVLSQEIVRRDVSTLMTAEADLPPLPPGFELDRVKLARSNQTFIASAILLPPIFALALGWIGLWIARGFRS
jgi:hypothetical protein